MTPELWERLKPLFHAALEQDTQNRAAFIESACGDDPELKTHLNRLLEAEQQKATHWTLRSLTSTISCATTALAQ